MVPEKRVRILEEMDRTGYTTTPFKINLTPLPSFGVLQCCVGIFNPIGGEKPFRQHWRTAIATGYSFGRDDPRCQINFEGGCLLRNTSKRHSTLANLLRRCHGNVPQARPDKVHAIYDATVVRVQSGSCGPLFAASAFQERFLQAQDGDHG